MFLKIFNRTQSSVYFWLLAMCIVVFSVYYQRINGPTYPLKDSIDINNTTKISYSMPRSHSSSDNVSVTLPRSASINSAELNFRSFGSEERFVTTPMLAEDTNFIGLLPAQKASQSLEYYIILHTTDNTFRIPAQNNIKIRFKNDVPPLILLSHIILTFLGMLFAARAGIAAVTDEKHLLKTLTQATAAALFLGGILFGGLVAKYAFGSYWSGFPVGKDLTDDKLLVAFLMWLTLAIFVRRNVHNITPVLRITAFIFSLLTLLIFLIPH